MNRFIDTVSKIKLSDSEKNEIAERIKNKKSRKIYPAVAVALCVLLIMLLPVFKNEETKNPLIITVSAAGENGEKTQKALKLNEKIELYEDKKTWEGEYEGYAFDLTLTEGRYLGLAALDKNLEIWRYPSNEVLIDGEIWYEPLPGVEIFWAMTLGDEIEVTGVNLTKKNIEDYKSGKFEPWKHGKSLIWVPNDEMIYELIQCYDENYKVIAEYILKMSEENGKYFAEIISVK